MESATDFDDLKNLTLAEPAAAVDQAILARARSELSRSRRLARALLALRLAAAASVLLAAPVWFLRPPGGFSPASSSGQADPAGQAGAPLAARPEVEARIAIESLRSEFRDLHEMSELIAPERGSEREEIRARVKACLIDLDNLERRLDRNLDSSFLPVPRSTTSLKKENNA